jgi:DNA-binding CsgD family transcriptional regulator
VAGFVAWLRMPPPARDGLVAVLPAVEPHCSAGGVNRKLSALTSFCGFHARHGVELSRLLITLQPTTGRGRGAATSYRPFLHHVSKRGGERRRTIKLKAPKYLPKVLTVQQVQAILDACEHLRDRLLFALMLDTGARVGEALGLRHEDIAIADKTITITPRDNDNRARAKTGVRVIPMKTTVPSLHAPTVRCVTPPLGRVQAQPCPRHPGYVWQLGEGDGHPTPLDIPCRCGHLPPGMKSATGIDSAAADTPIEAVPVKRPPLSARETEVLVAWLRVESKTAVARRLFITPATVRTHLQRIRDKYDEVPRPARTKAALAARAIQDGIIGLYDL